MEVNSILSQIDTDNSGSINYTEFIASCMEQALYQKEENVRMVFKMMDTNQDGRITKQELASIFTSKECIM